jgi:hypothetical protein
MYSFQQVSARPACLFCLIQQCKNSALRNKVAHPDMACRFQLMQLLPAHADLRLAVRQAYAGRNAGCRLLMKMKQTHQAAHNAWHNASCAHTFKLSGTDGRDTQGTDGAKHDARCTTEFICYKPIRWRQASSKMCTMCSLHSALSCNR